MKIELLSEEMICSWVKASIYLQIKQVIGKSVYHSPFQSHGQERKSNRNLHFTLNDVQNFLITPADICDWVSPTFNAQTIKRSVWAWIKTVFKIHTLIKNTK